MGFNFLSPLPLISKPFSFLKSVDLRTVGLDLSDVSVNFGWELVLFKPVVQGLRVFLWLVYISKVLEQGRNLFQI